MRIILIILLLNANAFCQNGQVYNTYRIKPNSTNESQGSIFPEPFQSFNYIKTHRGIEVYETYKTKIDSTNQSRGTVFSKPFPKFIIINNKMYETYKDKSVSTNESRQTIFVKPFESKQILNQISAATNKQTIKVLYEVKYKESLPMYNGEGEISYGE